MESTPEEDILQRLKKIEGQIKGLQRMVEDKRDCEQIVTQVLAVRAALDRVGGEIVRTHVNVCIDTLPPEKVKKSVVRAVELLSRLS